MHSIGRAISGKGYILFMRAIIVTIDDVDDDDYDNGDNDGSHDTQLFFVHIVYMC